jgi:hypothetical protein
MIITRIGMITPVGHDAQRSLHAGAQKTNSIRRRGPQILASRLVTKEKTKIINITPLLNHNLAGGS